MTKETISGIEALKALLPEGPDHLVLAQRPGFGADRLMAPDADRLRGAVSKHSWEARHRRGRPVESWICWRAA